MTLAPQRVYGAVPGYPDGSEFANRTALAAASVHRPLQGGISGGRDGADSIVVSGGYVDDEDYGDEIIYTGQGGRDENTGRQIADQKLVLGTTSQAQEGRKLTPLHPSYPRNSPRCDGNHRQRTSIRVR